ncbi:MAG: wax ester/triacylglycerol synthase family O-acyltransferase [Proteobacteria bacterium]|nr:wax ester/triacylglycerol synthase family O-acyltransferase [Pseudomonadota bacterium]
MSKISPMDLSFFLLENTSRQMHMTAYQLFKVPARQKNAFVAKVVKTYRESEVATPFNQKLKWLGKNVASWQVVKPDLNYHVRHVAVPTPGTFKQFYELVSFLNTPLLDRDQPPWECYIIEGLEDNHIAIMIKVHHALVDGGAALRLFRQSMSDSAKDKTIRAIWMPSKEKAPRRKRSRATESQMKKLLSSFGKLPSDIVGASTEFAKMGAQALKLRPKERALPFGAKKTIFNNVSKSSARRYANCEISLAEVKAISKKTGTTINDVVTTVIDDALHHYLKQNKKSIDVPLVSLMAMSLRTPGEEASGNQVSVELVPMGQPTASIGQRLQQVHESIVGVKARSKRLPTSVRMFYSMFIFGSSALADFSSKLEAIPSANLVISNMVGPKERLYMGGFPMVAFQGLPIVPPGGGLNVTFASFNKDICLAVGAAPEAVGDPYLLIQDILKSFEKLKKVTLKKQITAKKR